MSLRKGFGSRLITSSKERQTDKLMQFDQLVENAGSRNLKIDSAIDIDAIMNEMNNGLC